MKMLIPVLIFGTALIACNSDETTTATPDKTPPAPQRFFPVTGFIKGQLFTLNKINGKFKKYTTVDENTDSTYIKSSELEKELAEFLRPEIDTANLVSLFVEKSFMDQSINAVTLTYEAKTMLPDSLKLRRWDVYIHPDDNSVKRIYLVKEPAQNKTLQLTWVSNEWCKITSIVTDESGKSRVEKEEKFLLAPNQ